MGRVDDDVDTMIRLSGVEVSMGQLYGFGIVDTRDEDLMQAQSHNFAGKVITLTVRTGYFPLLKEGALIVIEQVDHKVLWTRQTDDGKVTHAVCVKK